MLWNKNFSLLIAANILLFIGVYMLFPLFFQWMVKEWGCTVSQASIQVALFAPAMFIPGAFNNYLVDTFSRKQVCIRSVLMLAAIGLISPYVPQQWMAVGLWMLQGVFFSLALMATGSTLVIDVTPSSKRNAANRVFTWTSILSTIFGLLIGLNGPSMLPIPKLLYLSSALCGCSAFLITMVQVCFRAPLDLPLCSFDRFILFRTLLPGLNMLCVPIVLGMVLSAMPDALFYLSIVGGFIVYLLLRQLSSISQNGKLQVFLGQVLTLAGLVVLLVVDSGVHLHASGFLIGLGTGFSIGHFLQMMILLPMHCERGTSYQTFQLLWQLGFVAALAVAVSGSVFSTSREVYEGAILVCIAGLLFYQLYTCRYFKEHYQQ
mgnify:FL=1